ncbi:GNAT family N-acetyltransferase [Trichocoleus sp. FACHB-591]|uniref:GNAT family N-acetyltransferase n=1 Tax=Trichocoleus sp. FACHB-591 TaxID=2692872 RepID=UPI001686DF76|nr:GNAT family N-acetyltransferase [Trichocoleus sp. FACHB-591]MBD2096192.1 GNAT family N-acetyltransferase [Trichocoleus sp. FACHB-591]
MLIRPYQTTDAEAIAAIYQDSVLGIGATAYNAEQIAVWSAYPDDIEEFRRSLQQGLTLVAVSEGQLLAFGQLNPLNHIAFLYTASQAARQGYATKIYLKLETYAIQRGVEHLHTEASRISKFFFLKMGYHITETEVVTRKGVELERFKMAKIISFQ